MVNILGLSIGIASFLILISYTTYEESFDDFHKNKEQTYCILFESYEDDVLQVSYPMVPPPLGNKIKDEVEEVQLVTRFSGTMETSVLKHKTSIFEIPKLRYVDSDFFKILDFELLIGDPKTVLQKPKSIVITETAAKKYFNDSNPIGKVVEIGNNYGRKKYTVTGIAKDIPKNTSFNFEVLCSYSTLNLNKKWFKDNWFNVSQPTYITLSKNSNIKTIESKITRFATKYKTDDNEPNRTWRFRLQPMKDFHLKSGFWGGSSVNKKAQTLHILKIIALLIIIISWVNYVNLSIANTTERAKETGIRKALGSLKKQIINQFMVEASLVNLIASITAVFMVFIVIKPFSNLLNLNYNVHMLQQSTFWIALALILIIGIITSGLYPAIVFASFNPVKVLNSKTTTTRGSIRTRTVLVGVQFIVSILMISCTLIIIHQNNFMKQQDLGMGIDDVLIIKKPKLIWNKKYQKSMSASNKN